MAYLGSSGMTRRIFPSQNSATTRSFFQPWKHNRDKKLQLRANNSEHTRLPMKQTRASSLGRGSLQNTSNKNKSLNHSSGKGKEIVRYGSSHYHKRHDGAVKLMVCALLDVFHTWEFRDWRKEVLPQIWWSRGSAGGTGCAGNCPLDCLRCTPSHMSCRLLLQTASDLRPDGEKYSQHTGKQIHESQWLTCVISLLPTYVLYIL